MGTAPTKLAPGIHPGIPFAEYLEIPAINASLLKGFAVSPKHALHKATCDDDTDAMALGRAVHAAILEPETYATEWVVAPRVDRRYKEGKRVWAEFCEASEGMNIVTAKDAATAALITETARGLPHVARLLYVTRQATELTVIAESPEHAGVLLKARIDLVASDGAVTLGDVKTTSAADLKRHTLEREIAKYGYHLQAALYHDLYAMASGTVPDEFVFVFCQTTGAHDVAAFALDDDAMAQGRKEYRRYLQQLLSCRASGVWPGVQPDAIETIGLPVYAMDSTLDRVTLNISGSEVTL